MLFTLITIKETILSVLRSTARRYLEVPQLITPSAFREIANLLDLKEGREALQSYFSSYSKEDKALAKMSDPFYTGYKFATDGKEESAPSEYGVLKVEGALTYKPEKSMCAPDTCNYQELVKSMEAEAARGVNRVVMIHDSCGGEAYAMMESARKIRKIADDNGIELVGYVDGLSASASYGLLSVCHTIIANPDASVGSIGVVISLVNNSEALKKKGFKRTFITAGASKVPFDNEGEFKDDFIEGLQKDVNTLYENFTSHVSNYRSGMSVEDVKNTEAKVFRAEEALSLGLIDAVMEVDEFKSKYLTSDENINTINKTNTETIDMAKQETPTVNMEDFLALQKELQAFKDAENARMLAEKTTAMETLASTAGFVQDGAALTAFLMTANEESVTMLSTVIANANTALETQKTEAATLLATKEEEFNAALTETTEKLEASEKAKESLKEEFAKPDAIRGEEKETNVVELDHKEKLARAVAAKLAERNASM